MKFTLTIFLLLACGNAFSQKLDVEFRTVSEPGVRLHYLKFLRGGKCTLEFPAKNHGDAMLRGIRRPIELQYRNLNDTITIHRGLDISSDTNKVVQRILNARFVAKGDGLYDCNSGYTYIDRQSISDKYTVYVIDGSIFKQRVPKVDSYGLVLRSYLQNWKLKRKLKKINADEYDVRILRGREAYRKYGKLGMNLVFEINRKL